jgi:hypothetical protein
LLLGPAFLLRVPPRERELLLKARAVPLQAGGSHWAQGSRSQGQEVIMDPATSNGIRKQFTPLDLAGLDDIGWQLR